MPWSPWRPTSDPHALAPGPAADRAGIRPGPLQRHPKWPAHRSIWIFWCFGDERISEPGLEIPHPRMAERDFVMIPLVELASNDQDRGAGRRVVTQLLRTSSGKVPRSTACGRSCSKHCLARSRFPALVVAPGDGLARAQPRPLPLTVEDSAGAAIAGRLGASRPPGPCWAAPMRAGA